MVWASRPVRVRGFVVLAILLISSLIPSISHTSSAQQAWSLPSPWNAQDIGSPAIVGTASVDRGTFTITAAGADVSGRSDQFSFIYQQVTGDVDVSARIDSISSASSGSKSGVMIRSSLAANAAHGFALVSAGRGVDFRRRTNVGGMTSNTNGPSVAAPYWVRLVRKGTTLTAYASANGTSWSTISSRTISLGASAYVGIATTSGTAATATTAAVSNVSVVPLSLPAPQQSADIGAPSITGSESYAQGVYRVHAGGTDIWGTSDQFHFVYQPLAGDGEVVARVQSISNTNTWAKAGVMIRESLTADSRHAFALLSAGAGYAFQRRIDPAGISQSTSGAAGSAPGWVRLVRTGSRFDAYRSADGSTWTLIGSDAVPMGDNVYVGIAVTSHNTSTATDAVIDNFKVVQGTTSNQPPNVAITSPTDGSIFTAGKDIAVTAAANDADGTVSRVDFFAGSTSLGSVASAPYSVTWAAVPAGTYSLKAVAVDNDGASTSSATVSVRVDPAANKPPTVSLTAPSNGATFTAPATVALAATAADSDGTIAKVEFYNGSSLLNADATAPYSFSWTSVGAGTYTVKAIAYDNSGATTSSATATVTVTGAVNQPPNVTLTSPAAGATFTAPASVPLAATATDTDGTIAKVEFYNGTTLLNTDTTSPYSFTWGSVAAGTYTVKAIAYDNAGASKSSTTATITVATSTTNGLIGAYSLDEGTGSVAGNTSGSGPSGTITNATWTGGRFGQALSFSGNGEVNFGDVDFTGPFTVEGWFQTRSLYSGTCGSFVMKALDYGFEICGGQLGAKIAANGTWSASLLQPLTSADLNVWKHVAMTYDGTTLRLFIGGSLIKSAAGAHTSNNSPLLFGHWTPAAEYWNGLIDEVRLYSRALTQAEIQTDMNTAIGSGTGNRAPTVSLTSPAAGATFTAPASVTLSASATDSDGTISKVEFYNGTTLLNSDTASPYSFNWTSVAAGTYTVKAIAYDNSGASASSATSTITVSGAANQAPTVTLTAPANGATFTAPGTVTLSATASDPDGTISKVEFYNGTTLLNSDTASPYSFSWTSVAAGTYTVKAIAYDNSGASTPSTTATITVNGAANQAPTVTLTAPANGATFTAPATVTLSATASDPDGTISKVEFYNGTTLLNTDTTSPYSYSWLSVLAGTYTVKAIAYDNSGASKSSATSTITVSQVVTTPPTGVAFTASPDHATLVTSYELRIYASGANPQTATPIAISNLGKPTPDANNDITVDLPSFFVSLAPGNYVAAVAAIGGGGSSISTGVSFSR